MTFAVAVLLGLFVGFSAFGVLVCGWAILLLLHILEELRCIEQLLRPNFYQRLGLDAPEI